MTTATRPLQLLAVWTAACLGASHLPAQVFPAPPSWRGGPTASVVRWDFLTDANPAVGVDLLNVPTPILADVQVEPIFGTGWYVPDGIAGDVWGTTLLGLWDVARGGIEIDLPATPPSPELGFLLIRVQSVYHRDINDAPVESIVGATLAGVLPVEDSVVVAAPFGAWRARVATYLIPVDSDPTQTIRVEGNPTWGTLFDSVLIDYAFVPEPADFGIAVGAAALALVAIYRRRRPSSCTTPSVSSPCSSSGPASSGPMT